MVWPRPLPSARAQWNQSTYATIPGGNWGEGHFVEVMNNGDVIVATSRVTSYQYDEEMGVLMFTRVRPEGCERISCDPAAAMLDGVYYIETPDSVPGWNGKGDIRNYPLVTYNDFMMSANDGENIWFYEDYWRRMWRFNPSTYELEHVAGQYGNFGTLPRESSVGLNVFFDKGSSIYLGLMTYHDGFLYWFADRNAPGSSDVETPSLMRMSTTAPYPVSEVMWFPPALGNQADYYAWLEEINPATGLYNFLNDEIYHYYIMPSIAFYEGDLYFLSHHDGVNKEFFEFGRINIAEGTKTTLYYGVDSDIVNEPTERDLTHNQESTPNGTLASNGLEDNWSPRLGTPYYEAFTPSWHRAVIMGDLFVTCNWSTTMFYSGFQVYGETVITFDIPDILRQYAENGNKPIRHDRRNPIWNTIANGTCGDESSVGYNGRNEQRVWSNRDGAAPLISHALWRNGIAAGRGDLEGSLLVVTPTVARSFLGQGTNNGNLVKLLTPSDEGGSMQVRVVFEGTQLKGYSHVSQLERSSPSEVRLS